MIDLVSNYLSEFCFIDRLYKLCSTFFLRGFSFDNDKRYNKQCRQAQCKLFDIAKVSHLHSINSAKSCH